MSQDYRALRREYLAESLDSTQLTEDPFAQFSQWLDAAAELEPDDATSMSLATANAEGLPSVRIVLLKHFSEQGFAWYTDYRSAKADDLATNPQASIMFYWRSLERQVRVQGKVEKLSSAEAENYFQQRPFASRLSAVASHQSAPIASRAALETQVDALEQKHSEESLTCPEFWGGYILKPTHFEFWQGRSNRLHDRFVYKLEYNNWQIERLQP